MTGLQLQIAVWLNLTAGDTLNVFHLYKVQKRQNYSMLLNASIVVTLGEVAD